MVTSFITEELAQFFLMFKCVISDYLILFCVGFLFMGTVGYWLFLAIANKFKNQEKNQKVDKKEHPFVSVIIPTYNEEANIERKIKSLIDLNYPKSRMEIIVVDDGSTDNTVDVIRQMQKNIRDFCSLRVIQLQHRGGPANALYMGSCSAKGDIIVCTDADASLQNKNAMQIAIHRLSDVSIGAIIGLSIPDKKEKVLRPSNKYQHSIYTYKQKWESQLDSVIQTGGTFYVVRKKFIKFLRINCINYDSNLAIEIRKSGFKVLIEPKILSSHVYPETIKSYSYRSIRVFIGNLESLFRHYRILFNPRYGYYGMIIAPQNLLFCSIEPAIFVVACIAIIHTILINSLILPFLKFSILIFFIMIFLKCWFPNTKIYEMSEMVLYKILGSFATFLGYFKFISYIYHRNISSIWNERE